MRWHDFSIWGKIAIVALGLWYTVGWLVAIKLPDPSFFMSIPMLVIIGTLAMLTVIGWVLRRLGH